MMKVIYERHCPQCGKVISYSSLKSYNRAIKHNSVCQSHTQFRKNRNILEEANNIVNNCSEEKTRQYGPFIQSMEKMRDIFNDMTNKDLTTEDMYMLLVATKLSRLSHSFKYNSLLDAICYLGALGNYLEEKQRYSC